MREVIHVITGMKLRDRLGESDGRGEKNHRRQPEFVCTPHCR
jgi:hypothetical protein